MDSVTLAHHLHNSYPEATQHVLSFDYGQRHVKELQFARACASDISADFDIIDLSMLTDLLAQSGSSLVNRSVDVPLGHYEEESMKATVVPNRNAIMLSIATGIAVAEYAWIVATGVHAGDHAVYPDCRPHFIQDMNAAMRAGNEGFCEPDFHIVAPFVHSTKADIVTTGSKIGVDYSKTWSCYQGELYHCGQCGTCVERREAFELAGVEDPTIYAPLTGGRS
jgi:7-cyano-7-deazaguanine synthase